jgi:hypothetical protein
MVTEPLDSPAPVVATLRAMIAASYRVLAAGQEGK